VEQNLEKVKRKFDVIIKCFINILCFFANIIKQSHTRTPHAYFG